MLKLVFVRCYQFYGLLVCRRDHSLRFRFTAGGFETLCRMSRPASSISHMKKALTVGVVLCGLLASPVQSQLHAQGRPKMDDPQARPFAKLSSSAQMLRDSIVAFAKRQLGVKYRRGASSPDRGFDCSGLVQYVMEHFNIELPRTSREQAKAGIPLARDLDALKPGDLLTFGHGKKISHIGIYIGNGKFVHANTPGGHVKEGTLVGGKWWRGARRVIASTDTTLKIDPGAN